MKHTFTVTSAYEKWRLDKFLAQKLPLTRSQIKKLILNDQVVVNKEQPTVHQFLNEGDIVGVLETEISATETEKTTKKVTHKNSKSPKVLFDEKDYLIIEKPAGLLVHATARNENYTLVDWLLKNFPQLRKVGEDPLRPAIVHRLDKDVSGLMIIPKSQTAFDYFKSQFKLRKIKKTYTTLVHDVVENQQGLIDFSIARSKEGKYVARPKDDPESRSAETEFFVKKRYLHFTLLELHPLTGRTNQLRVHMAAYGHPMVGDNLYATRKKVKPMEISQVFLHATGLTFYDPEGVKRTYQSPLPKELKTIIDKLN